MWVNSNIFHQYGPKCSLKKIVKIDRFKFSSSSSYPPPHPHPHSSVKSVNSRMLRIITSNPIVTTINNAKPNHPSTIAVVPTPLFTLPLPRSCAIVLAATEAVCCQSTETRTKTEATKMRARETWETGREGKGFTSRMESSSVVSSCQPGKVARRRKQKNARTMATMLGILLVLIQCQDGKRLGVDSHEIWKHYTIFERRCYPYQIQRILIHRHLCSQRRRIIRAQE